MTESDELFPEHQLFHELWRRPMGRVFPFAYSGTDRGELIKQLTAAGVAPERADAAVDQLNADATSYAFLATRRDTEQSPKEVRDSLSAVEADLSIVLLRLTELSLEAKVELEHAYADEELSHEAQSEPAEVFKDFYNGFVSRLIQLQSIADRAYVESTSKVHHHRPKDTARSRFMYWLAGTWHKATGELPTSTIGGAFWRFARAGGRPVFTVTDDLIKDTARHYRDHHDADAEVHRLTDQIIRGLEDQGENPS